MRRYSAIEPLHSDHRRRQFSCSSPALTEWFRQQALHAQLVDTTRVYVVRRASDDLVIGFYAISGGSVRREDSPVRLLKGTGRYPEMPVLVLGRLAVDVSETGRGLGHALLQDAFRRLVRVASEVGIRALLVHAEDEQVADFCLKIAPFEPGPTDDRRLILLMKDLRRAVV